MSRITTLGLFFLATFLQAGAYGLTFMLPRLFETFGANEKVVGVMLSITAVSTLVSVYFAGHMSDRFGRVRTLGFACLSIAIGLASFGLADGVGALPVLASVALGAGWALTYALAPIVMTRLVPVTERVRFFAILSVMVMAGFGLSPVMASMMENAGLRIRDAFFVSAFLCLIAGLLFFMLIYAIREHSAASGIEPRSSLTLPDVVGVLKSPARLPLAMALFGASVFAGMTNFQTVFATERGLDYAAYFLAYTITVIAFRIVLARFKGGTNPYGVIAGLQYIMAGSVVLFLFIGGSFSMYLVVAFLFGIGYGVSYPILVAMAANDARDDLLPQTLQLFALVYFIGVFGFPLVAGWIIVDLGTTPLLVLTAAFATIEASMALMRALARVRE